MVRVAFTPVLIAGALLIGAAAPQAPASAPVPAPTRQLAGDWAGDGFALRSAPTGTIVQGKCAWGQIEGGIWLAPDGAFRAAGYYNPYSSGIKLSDFNRRDVAASFEGQVTGKTLALTLRIAGKPDRRLVLRQGAKIKFGPCK